MFVHTRVGIQIVLCDNTVTTADLRKQYNYNKICVIMPIDNIKLTLKFRCLLLIYAINLENENVFCRHVAVEKFIDCCYL